MTPLGSADRTVVPIGKSADERRTSVCGRTADVLARGSTIGRSYDPHRYQGHLAIECVVHDRNPGRRQFSYLAAIGRRVPALRVPSAS